MRAGHIVYKVTFCILILPFVVTILRKVSLIFTRDDANLLTELLPRMTRCLYKVIQYDIIHTKKIHMQSNPTTSRSSLISLRLGHSHFWFSYNTIYTRYIDISALSIEQYLRPWCHHCTNIVMPDFLDLQAGYQAG